MYFISQSMIIKILLQVTLFSSFNSRSSLIKSIEITSYSISSTQFSQSRLYSLYLLYFAFLYRLYYLIYLNTTYLIFRKQYIYQSYLSTSSSLLYPSISSSCTLVIYFYYKLGSRNTYPLKSYIPPLVIIPRASYLYRSYLLVLAS